MIDLKKVQKEAAGKQEIKNFLISNKFEKSKIFPGLFLLAKRGGLK